MLSNKQKILLAVLPCFLSLGCATPPAPEQSLVKTYRGVGRIAWAESRQVPMAFVVPHFTAGARRVCTGNKVECEISVMSRDIAVAPEDRIPGLRKIVEPYLPRAVDKTFQVLHHGADRSITYTLLEDADPGDEAKFLIAGYALKGTAVIQFQATAMQAADLTDVLTVVARTRALDARALWALRFADYNAVCGQRFPAFSAVNAEALAASPLSEIDLLAYFKQQEPAWTDEAVQRHLEKTRQGFANSFGEKPAAEQRSFCQRLPKLLAEAASEGY
jgi:hypothetical protein